MDINNIILSNVQEALDEYKAYNSIQNSTIHGDLMLDRDTGKLWCNVHINEGDITIYHDNAIINLGAIVDELELGPYTSRKHIYSAIKIIKYAINEIIAYSLGKETCRYKDGVAIYTWYNLT